MLICFFSLLDNIVTFMQIGMCDSLLPFLHLLRSSHLYNGLMQSVWNNCVIAVGWANVKWALVTRKMNWDSGIGLQSWCEMNFSPSIKHFIINSLRKWQTQIEKSELYVTNENLPESHDGLFPNTRLFTSTKVGITAFSAINCIF